MEKKYSWPELIVLIFGVKRWEKVRDKYQLFRDEYKPKVNGMDIDLNAAANVKLSGNFLL